MTPRGLLVDYAGVLTTSVADAFAAFCRDAGLPEGLALSTFLRAHAAGADGPVQRVEVGAISGEEFARELAALLASQAGVDVDPDGLLDRLFAGLRPEEPMFAVVAAVHAAGVRTGLLSNSWGRRRYPRERFASVFDAVVISGEVGLRKPDPEIYALAAERLGVPAAACVFVDDIDVNVAAARAAGMHGVLHTDTTATTAHLAEVFALPLGELAAAHLP